MADIFTQVGEEHVIDQIDAFGAYFVAWGSGAGISAKGDTTLFTEEAETRVSATKSQPVADKINFNATLTALAGKTITNAGVFTLIAAGILVVKGDFTGIVLNLGDKIEFDISLEQT